MGKKKGQNEKALKYHFKAYKLGKGVNDNNTLGTVTSNIAEVYTQLEQDSLALIYFEQALIAHKGTENESYPLVGIGRIFFHKGDYSKALQYFNKALNISRTMGVQMDMASSLNMIGRIYFKQKDLASAIKYCNEALFIAESINNKKEQQNANRILARIYKLKEDYSSAFNHQEKLTKLNSEIYNIEFDQKMAGQIFNYEIDKKQNEIALLNKENEINQLQYEANIQRKNRIKNIILISGLFILVLAGGLWSRLQYVRKSKSALQKEKDVSEGLLLNILPAEVADELKAKGYTDAREFEHATILFTDFKGFTSMSEQLSASDLVYELNVCFKGFDHIMEKYGIEKIKTIGDAYMAAGGLHNPRTAEVSDVVNAGLEMQQFMASRKLKHDELGIPSFEMRVGIHTGPVIAGVVGIKKFQYDIWGDTVNTASRMESSGAVGKVNISQSTHEFLKEDSNFTFESRGKIQAKGKGEMEMWFVKLNESL